MQTLHSIEQAETLIRQYSDFLSQAKLAQLYRLVDEYRQAQIDLQAAGQMMEEGAPARLDIQINNRDRRILDHIQQILESA